MRHAARRFSLFFWRAFAPMALPLSLLLLASDARPRLLASEVSSQPVRQPVERRVLPYEPLLVNRERRGRDQRHSWVRGVAALHPALRLSAAAAALALVAARSGLGDDVCLALRLGGSLLACAAALELGSAAAIAAAAVLVAVVSWVRGEREESRDFELTELGLAAAASSASYAPPGRPLLVMLLLVMLCW